VLVYADSVADAPSSFTIRADASPVLVTTVAPVLYGADSVATMTLNGAGFTNATTVALVSSDGTTVYPATSVSFDTFTQLTATIDLTGVPQGTYSVRVTNAGGSDTLPAAFTVTAAGQANFETHLILPSAVGRHVSSTFYIEYSNTGTVAMPAPVVLLESSVADDLPLFTLDKSLVVSGFWTSAIPQGYSNTVEILASGKVPGVLEPGESVTVPVYYAGMQQPWNFNESQFKFDLRVFLANNSVPVDWYNVLATMNPPGFTSQGWQIIEKELASQLGEVSLPPPEGGLTPGNVMDYVQLLDNEASYLGQLGEDVTDVNQLWAFAVAQADNALSPIGPALASATDDSVATPGSLSLSFSRVFAESINGRNTLGPLGYGWSTPWQTTATTAPDGTVTITGADGAQRVFQPDSRQAGAFFSQPGDTGTLTDDGHGGYLLTEADGTATDYNANGTLNYVRDTDGNRITAGYTAGLLTSLTTSSGQWIGIAYNSAGLISTVTDSEGRTTTYMYDSANQFLLSVKGFNGQTTNYQYYSGDEVSFSSLNALESIAFPGGTHEYFTYDTQGRLTGISADNGAQPLTFAYSMGEVSVTDGTGDTTQFYYNEQGLLVKTVDPLGNATLNTYDSNFNLTQLTNALGQSGYFTYNGAGEVTSSTDFLGNTTYFTYSGPFNNLSSMTDANGNTTSYDYDSAGDLLSTTYANGTTETSTFDPEGNATSFLNANGQATQYTYNASGQMLTETFSDGSQYTYSYNAFGELATATDATGTTTFTYDPTTELLTKVAYPNGMFLSFSYNAAGQRTSMVDQTGFTVNYAYDSVGRLSQLTDGSGNVIVTYTYDADGRLSEKVNGNGTYTTYQYDADGNVLHLINYAPGGTINSRFDYTYNSMGLETSEATLDGTWTYTYDVDGQLIDAVFASTNPTVPSQDLAYSYDAMGNRISTVINGVATPYTTNDVNEYTSVGGVADTYDADGNLTSDGTNTYTYNSLNQLIGISGPSGTTTYTYNALGQQVASTTNGQTTQYLIDPSGLGNVIGEYSGSGALIADYTYGLGLTSQVTTEGSSYYDFDALGSASELTNAAGIVLDSYAYGPFGLMVQKSKTAGNPFEFVGEYGLMDDGNGLIHMGVRVYDSSTGGFLTRDPLNSETAYLYANDTPTNRVDPLGLRTATVTIPIEPPFGSLAISAANNPVTGERFVGVGVSLSTGGVFFWNSPNGTQGFSTSFPVIGGGISVSTGSPPSVPTSIYIAGWAAGHIPLLWPGAANLFDGGQFSGWWSLWGQGQSSLQGSPGQGIGASFRWGFFIRVHAPVLNGTGGVVVTAPNANSEDPNSMVGPGGYGTPNFVADAGAALPYQIDFENSSSATAPAQAVTITDQLDPNLDWSTFQLTGIGWGDAILAIPAGSQHYETTVSMTYNGQTFDVDVQAGIDTKTGQVYATFQSIDPITDLPPDVLTGFLPPEDGTGRGWGYISFMIQPNAGLPTGTQIRNVALITFDQNPAIATD
jgi:RHS repeat-associated protein